MASRFLARPQLRYAGPTAAWLQAELNCRPFLRDLPTRTPARLPNNSAGFQFAFYLLPNLKLDSVNTSRARSLHIGGNVTSEEALLRGTAGVSHSFFVNQRRRIQRAHLVRQDEMIKCRSRG